MKNQDMPAMPIFDDDAKPCAVRDPETGNIDRASGLTKREMFAMHAMQALIPIYWNMTEEYKGPEALVKCLSESALDHADALIKELEK